MNRWKGFPRQRHTPQSELPQPPCEALWRVNEIGSEVLARELRGSPLPSTLFSVAEKEIWAGPTTVGLCGHPFPATDTWRTRMLADAWRGVRRAADRREWRLLHGFPRPDGTVSPSLLGELEHRDLTALILEPGQTAVYRAVTHQTPTLVLLDEPSDLPQAWSAVTVCLREPLMLAIDSLLAAGYRRIALQEGMEEDVSVPDQRLLRETFDKIVRECGAIPCEITADAAPSAVIGLGRESLGRIAAAVTAAGLSGAIPVIALDVPGAIRPSPAPSRQAIRLTAIVEIDTVPLGEEAIRWIEEIVRCPGLCGIGGFCEGHGKGVRRRLTTGRLLTI